MIGQEDMIKNKLRRLTPEKVLWGFVFIFCFFLTYHEDLHETSNHSYLFLESIFSGNFFDFYGYVESRPMEIYYINLANYNFLVYLLFGLWQLPVYIVTKLFSLAPNEYFLLYYTKVIIVAFYVGCGYLVGIICRQLNLTKQLCNVAAMFFLFNPIAFFSPMVMGQYDSVCLFFLLLALKYYLDGDMVRFSLLMGVSGIFKFFAYLIFIPLLLLKVKKLLPLAGFALMSLWLYLPSSLLFLGRADNSSHFTSLMFERLFAVAIPSGHGDVSFFLMAYAVICFFCLLQSDVQRKDYLSVYVPLCVFALLFFSIYWHPQWLILMMPFVVITTFMQKNRVVFWYVDILLCLGFFMIGFLRFPGQLAANLFSGQIVGTLTGTALHLAPNMRALDHFITLIPYSTEIISLCFAAALLVNVLFKFRTSKGSIADLLVTSGNNTKTDGMNVSLSKLGQFDRFSYRIAGYAIFLIGFLCFWLLPSIFEYLNAFNVV